MLLAAVTAAVIVLPAAAQFGGRGGGFGGPGALLGNAGVQKEIKLTEDQLKKYEEFNKGNESKRQEMREAFMNQDREKAQEIQKELAAATEKFVKDTLTADQAKRLKQITRQTMGPNAFTDEEVAKELKLTDEQKEGVKKIVEDLGAQSKEAFSEAGQDPEARQAVFKKIQGFRTEATDKITKMLTADQKKTWKDLTGDKFEIQFGPRGGGGKGKGKGKAEE
jgi:hypothetical protein